MLNVSRALGESFYWLGLIEWVFVGLIQRIRFKSPNIQEHNCQIRNL